LKRPDGIDSINALKIPSRQLIENGVFDMLRCARVIYEGIETAPSDRSGYNPLSIVV
jgi:hypothetical protein